LSETVEEFVYSGFGLDLSTLFQKAVVEKPVENVENSCVKAAFPGSRFSLCQLNFSFIGFHTMDMCIYCE